MFKYTIRTLYYQNTIYVTGQSDSDKEISSEIVHNWRISILNVMSSTSLCLTNFHISMILDIKEELLYRVPSTFGLSTYPDVVVR